MLNDLEITFFALFLDENGWCHSELQSQCKNMTDFLNITEIKDHSEYISLLLFRLLVAFTVKVKKIHLISTIYNEILYTLALFINC